MTKTYDDEKVRLDECAPVFYSAKAQTVDRLQKIFCLEHVLPETRGPRVLELSYNDGLWTDAMLEQGYGVTVVEGAELLINHAQNRYAGNADVTCVHSLFEEFDTDEVFDDVLMPYILEHVIAPSDLLKRARKWVKPGGNFHILVPNAGSLHRRIGVAMGLIPDLDYLDTTDLEVGHRRQYTPDMLSADIDGAGLNIEFCKGVFVKPLNSALLMDWPEERLRGFNALSEELPDYCAFLYAKATLQA